LQAHARIALQTRAAIDDFSPHKNKSSSPNFRIYAGKALQHGMLPMSPAILSRPHLVPGDAFMC
jgi:hypothetical protein